MDRFESFYINHYPTCLNTVKNLRDVIQNKVILDVGSNIGLFAKAIIETTSYREIHLFEPSTELFEKSKLVLSGFHNIHYNNVGLGDLDISETLYKDPGSNIGWNTILTKDPNQLSDFYKNLNSEKVKIVRLDEYYKDIEDIGFIKIDVEGYERHVIEGALSLIEKFKPYLLVEVGWGMRHPEWDLNITTYEKLFDLGYERINFHPTETQDILFVPSR